MSTVRAVVASALVYAGAIAIMGRHLLPAPGGVIANDVGDPVLIASILAWNARTMPWTDAWFDFPAFYPASDVLTFTEHFLGVSVIASPVYWITGDAIAAYNLTLLASYVLTGLAMFALVLRLTGSRAAAFVAGTAFAFGPYRASQLPHLQMAVVFWAPLALLGLHAFVDSGRRRWLVLFGASWLLQGASNGYYLVFFSVLVGCWISWFVVLRRRWRDLAWIAGTLAIAVLPLVPILSRYISTHARYGFSRNREEIVAFSADAGALLCASPHLEAWGWLRVVCVAEGELFPGVTILLACLGGAAVWARRREWEWDRPFRQAATIVSAGVVVLLAALALWSSPSLLRVSASSVEKPLMQALGVAALAALWWVAAPRLLRRYDSSRADALRRPALSVLIGLAMVLLAAAAAVALGGPFRWQPADEAARLLSTVALLMLVAGIGAFWRPWSAAVPSASGFYIVAALVTWVLAWGPVPLAWREPFLPQGLYAWLMWLPGMDGLRVPARFWMMTALCLSVAVGYATALLVRRSRTRAVAAGLVCAAAAGLVIDGWATIPAAKLLPPPPRPETMRGGVVLTLPLGSNADIDLVAQYAAVVGGWRSVNGFSGYEPPHYDRLRRASETADPALLAPFLGQGDLHVVIRENWNALTNMIHQQPGATLVASTPEWRQYRIPRQGRARAHAPAGRRLAIRSLAASCSEDLLPLAIDGAPSTRWHCGPQASSQEITVDLGSASMVGQVMPALGRFPTDYPRQLRIETSLDGAAWDPAWDGSVLAEVMEGQIHDPMENRYIVEFPPRLARYVRLRLQSSDNVWYWSIAELEVWSGRREQ